MRVKMIFFLMTLLSYFLYAQRTLRLLVPNGGENWLVGDCDTIKWTWTGNITRVKFEYSTNLGGTWNTIETSTTNDSFCIWNIPNTPSNQTLVKVTDVESTSVADVSDNPFNLLGSIRIVYPVGGETLTVGGRANIRWSASKGISKVKLEYSTNGGSSWTTIAGATQNDTIFPWNIPNTPSNQCRVRITDYDVAATNDMSPANFTIAARMAVTYPNGGENLQVGSNQNITWTAPSGVIQVKIEYSTNGGSSWTTIASGVPNNGIYAWETPNTPSAQCRVKVSDYNNSSITDMSDSDFRIVSGVTVVSPNGGEQLRVGRIHYINWTAPSGIYKVNIEYSTNGGSTWTSITSYGGWPNRLIYGWNVPNTPSTQCRVRISDADNATTVYDISDSNFAITATGIEEENEMKRPLNYYQSQNIPNPFQKRARISFAIIKSEKVQIKVYNSAGELVRVLIDEKRGPGSYTVEWDGKDDRGRDLPGGVYFYQLQTDGFIDHKKAVLLR